MNIEDVKRLRQETGAGITDCKQIYDSAGENYEKALEILKKQAAETAEKKSIREIKTGLIDAYIHMNGKAGVLMHIGCETDFVAKNEDFKKAIHDIAMHIVAMNPSDEEELFSQQFVKNPEVTVKDYLNDLIAKMGENIKIEQFVRFEI